MVGSIYVAILVAILTACHATTPTVKCNTKEDIAFLVESSRNVDWKKMQDLLIDVINELTVGVDGNHLAIIAYSANATITCKFNTLQGFEITVKGYIRLIRAMKWQQGRSSFLDKALRLASQDVFAPSAGMRKDVRKSVIVLAGKSQSSLNDLSRASKSLKNKGVILYVYAVYFGYDVTINQIRDIATSNQHSGNVGNRIGSFVNDTKRRWQNKCLADCIFYHEWFCNWIINEGDIKWDLIKGYGVLINSRKNVLYDEKAILKSPVIKGHKSMMFRYQMYGGGVDTVAAIVTRSNNSIKEAVWFKYGDQSNNLWRNVCLALEYDGDYKVSFEAVFSSNKTTDNWSIALGSLLLDDYVSVCKTNHSFHNISYLDPARSEISTDPNLPSYIHTSAGNESSENKTKAILISPRLLGPSCMTLTYSMSNATSKLAIVLLKKRNPFVFLKLWETNNTGKAVKKIKISLTYDKPFQVLVIGYPSPEQEDIILYNVLFLSGRCYDGYTTGQGKYKIMEKFLSRKMGIITNF
ncbi:MAM and LDL-receptor class A domain-containing protein 2 [Exaiptasia diaphana]|nr:MAM and LDL-receptor class A domain-containing protein 2 [Exaiptasia diaphana]